LVDFIAPRRAACHEELVRRQPFAGGVEDRRLDDLAGGLCEESAYSSDSFG
jgi:hypothetical protein